MQRSKSPVSIHNIAYTQVGPDYHIHSHSHNVYQWYCVLYGAVETILIPPGAVRSPRYGGKAPDT